MKINWLVPTIGIGSLVLCSSAAEAGNLVSWRFDANQNRLIFNTDEGVQPQAKLIADPTRLVIDLPGTTLGQPTVYQDLGGAVASLRVGQFEANVTRLVVELAPGYIIDPQKVAIRGTNPISWAVDLPTPQKVALAPIIDPKPDVILPPEEVTSGTKALDFEVTQNGLFVRLEGEKPDEIKVRRSGDRRQIDIDLEGVTLPNSLAARSLAVNRYGVSQIQFNQRSSSPPVARVTLNVSKDSPDWRASFSRYGGLALVPEGGIRAVETDNDAANQPVAVTSPATIEAVDLTLNGNQLLIRSDRQVGATGNWNRRTGVYELRINNAQLSNRFVSPRANATNLVESVQVTQVSGNTVLIRVKPAPGIQIGELNQPSEQLISLRLQNSTAVLPRETSIPVPLPENPLPVTPTPRPTTSTSLPRIPNGRISVVIDPGHGGKDPGALGIGGLRETDINLAVSRRVEEILEQQGVRVIMTRSDNRFISLEGRTSMANRAGADLFVSIHSNSIGGRPDVSGLETYYYSSGRQLAQTIHKNILQRLNVRDRGVRTARFYVLRNSSMPAVLVETGFVTGREDAARLATTAYRDQMAEAIAAGVLEYIQRNML
ncbi:MAG: N-acetylmuramoyl-L-alanine amidase [Oscillatoria sp. PMC 1068.18]|nr:N-acetylmuramoyl-L-alanine amidase [Oscillatoria sp. PMC 1068.18]